MAVEFYREYEVLWAYVDPNGHLRHTAYSDYATNVRLQYLKHLGFGLQELVASGIGPIVVREFIEYKKEIYLEDTIKIDMALGGISMDASRWLLRHRLYKQEQPRVCCTILMEGAWLDLKDRKICMPPREIHDGFQQLSRTREFKVMDKRFRLKQSK